MLYHAGLDMRNPAKYGQSLAEQWSTLAGAVTFGIYQDALASLEEFIRNDATVPTYGLCMQKAFEYLIHHFVSSCLALIDL